MPALQLIQVVKHCLVCCVRGHTFCKQEEWWWQCSYATENQTINEIIAMAFDIHIGMISKINMAMGWWFVIWFSPIDHV